MAQRAKTKKAADFIPESLARHIQVQQDRAMLVTANLECVLWALEAEQGERTEVALVALRHLNDVVCELHGALDSVNIARAAGAQS